MDYYIKCAEVIIYRNQYVLRCNKCHYLFLALEPFIKHFDNNHRRTDGSDSPCSRVYIDRSNKNETFDAYANDHDISAIEKKGHHDSHDGADDEALYVKVKKEKKSTVIVNGDEKTEPSVSQLMTDQTGYSAPRDVPANFVVSIPQSNLMHTHCKSGLKRPLPYSDDDTDDDFKLDGLSSSDGFDPTQINTDDSECDKTHQRKRQITRRSRWHEDERKAIYEYFGDLRDLEKLPTLRQCVDVIRNYPVLSRRTGPQVKSWIDNQRRYKLT